MLATGIALAVLLTATAIGATTPAPEQAGSGVCTKLRTQAISTAHLGTYDHLQILATGCLRAKAMLADPRTGSIGRLQAELVLERLDALDSLTRSINTEKMRVAMMNPTGPMVRITPMSGTGHYLMARLEGVFEAIDNMAMLPAMAASSAP